MNKKIDRNLIFAIIFFALFGNAAAQISESSAESDFDNYERGLTQTSTATTKPVKKMPKSPAPRKIKLPYKQSAHKPKVIPVEKKANSGLPGIKIWSERQVQCEGQFFSAAPTSIFTTGDCVRLRYKLNFEGYLTIVNLGTSGNLKVIFPLEEARNLVYPTSENYLPNEKGWEFEGEAGSEQLFFVVSNKPLDKKYLDDFIKRRSLTTEDSSALKIYDRDLVPRSENNSIYVLADEQKLEKAVIFRLTLKHR